MTNLHDNLEQWLIAERQQMSRPGALTSFLANKADMLQAVSFGPMDSGNIGASKSRSHIGQCKQLMNVIEFAGLDPTDTCRQLGTLASKALKVASGYSMRAGYFHPEVPKKLYRDRMVGLVDADRARLPVLGMELSALEQIALDYTGIEPAQTIDDMKFLFEAGDQTADQADKDLRELLLEERQRDAAFSGSREAQHAADTLTTVAKSIFVAVGMGALRLQKDGPDGLGPLILEPKSDANAHYYLRADKLQPTTIDQITYVSSPDMLARV